MAVANYNIGLFIRAYRLRCGIIQEKLLAGESDSSTVYRTETSSSKPRLKTAISFLEAMGFRVDQYLNVYEAVPDKQADRVAEELLYSLNKGDVQKAKSLISFLEAAKAFKSGVKLQFLLNCKAMLMIMENYDLEEILKLAYSAMEISYKDYNCDILEVDLLLPQEVDILKTVAYAYKTHNDVDMAVNILTDIEAVLYKLPAEYMDKDQSYIGVVITLTEYLMEEGRYHEAYEFSEKACSYSVNYCKGYRVHSIAYLKAVCLMEMGKQEEALEFFKQAYFGYIAYRDKETANEILEKINTAYGISIETYGTDTLEFDFKAPDFEALERGDVPKFEKLNELLGILRTEKNILQDELSIGICSRPHYTKIEGGTSQPNIYQKETLLQRLGRFPYYYTYNFLSNDEFMADKIKKGIVSAISRVEYDKARDMIAEIENKKHFSDNMGKLFILSSKAAIASDMEKKQKLLCEALAISLPKFNGNRISEYYLSFDEIQVINRLGGCYYQERDFRKAAFIYEALIQNMDSHYVDEYEKMRMYIILLCNYANSLLELNSFDETIEIADKAWRLQLKHKLFDCLPRLAGLKAEAYFRKGEKEKSMPYIVLAYYSSKLFGLEIQTEIFRKVAKDSYGIDLD